MNANFNEGSAIYLQVASMLEDDILRGVLNAEEQAPSTNELARAFCINPATAAKGLNLLVDDGILYKKRGLGMFVAPDGREKVVNKRKSAFYETYVKSLVKEAQALNVTKEELAAMIEKASGIPTMGFPTNGMHSYLSGASMAFAGLARRFCLGETEKTGSLSANILGLTPLDFSVNGSAQDIKALLEQNGIEVVSSWAMGSSLEELQRAGAAHVNLVVSHAGLETAKLLKERFGTPYVAGVPVGREFSSLVVQTLRSAARTGENAVAYPKKARGHFDGVIIGESVMAHSLAAAAALERAKNLRVLCPLEAEKELLGADSLHIHDETDIAECLAGERLIVADPLYKPICPKDAVFVPLAHEAFSGRIFRRDIPDLIGRELNVLF